MCIYWNEVFGFVFIKYFDCLPILNYWWKYLAVLSLNTDYPWNLLNYFYPQSYLQEVNPEMAVFRHCQIFQHIERHHFRQAAQFIRSLRKDRSSQERSISCSHGQQAEWYLQDWSDWNKQEIPSFLGEHWQNSWVNTHSFLFHPTVRPIAAEKRQVHNYWYVVPTVAFSLSIWWGQGRGHASVTENSVDRLSFAHVITQVRTCPQERESSFHSVQLCSSIACLVWVLPMLEFLCCKGK